MKKIILLNTIILLSVTASIAQQTYCVSKSTSWFEGYINRVTIGGIDNQTNGSYYTDYTSLSADVHIGTGNSITLSSTAIGKQVVRFAVYIDYNHNGSFSDAGERVVYDTLLYIGHARTFYFTPPSTTLNGPTRMRIQMREAAWNTIDGLTHAAITSPCSTIQYGEVEDYTVRLLGPYCLSIGNTTSEYINQVIFGSINNSSGDNHGYADFTLTSTDLTDGYTYPISLTPGFKGGSHTEYWKVYIDYNKNKSFIDPGELVGQFYGTSTVLNNIKIPITAQTGKTRMRIQMSADGFPVTPCDAIAHGETEDYTVNILPPVIGQMNSNSDEIVSIKPNPATINNTMLTYTLNKAGAVNILLSDISGSTQKVFNAGNKTAGSYIMPLNKIQSLRAGNYVLAIEQNGNIIARTSFIISE